MNSVKERIKKLGGSIDNGILIHPVKYRDLGRIKMSLKMKLNKLNGGNYKCFSHNYIFITTSDMIRSKECNDMINDYKNVQEGYDKKFEKILIYQFGGYFYELDMINNYYKIYEFSSNETMEIGLKARKMVEEREKNS